MKLHLGVQVLPLWTVEVLKGSRVHGSGRRWTPPPPPILIRRRAAVLWWRIRMGLVTQSVFICLFLFFRMSRWRTKNNTRVIRLPADTPSDALQHTDLNHACQFQPSHQQNQRMSSTELEKKNQCWWKSDVMRFFSLDYGVFVPVGQSVPPSAVDLIWRTQH